MTVIRRVLKVCLLVVIGAAATGCVVVPYGYGYGHSHHGQPGPHYTPQSDGYPGGAESPSGAPRRGWR